MASSLVEIELSGKALEQASDEFGVREFRSGHRRLVLVLKGRELKRGRSNP